MDETFDAYHKWLGIPPHERPPHHYRILAIDLFESDPDVISIAADQRMAHVRTFQSGPRAALSQQILNEIAAARVCLLNPDKKAEYDLQLQIRLAAEQAKAAGNPPEPPISAAPSVDLGLSQSAQDTSVARHLARRPRPAWQVPVGLAAAAVICGAVLTLALRGGGNASPKLVQYPDSEPPPASAPSHPVDHHETSDNPGTAESSPHAKAPEAPPAAKPAAPSPDAAPPTPDVKPEVPPSPQPPEKPPAGADPDAAVGLPTTDSSPPQPLPVPDAGSLAAAEAQVAPDLASAPPARMVATVLAGNLQPAECFYLLDKARQTAAKAGDVAMAARAQDELIQRFAVDALRMKADTLATLAKSPGAAPSADKIAGSSMALVDEAAAAGNPKLAATLAVMALKAARDAGNVALEREAALKIIHLRQSSPTP